MKIHHQWIYDFYTFALAPYRQRGLPITDEIRVTVLNKEIDRLTMDDVDIPSKAEYVAMLTEERNYRDVQIWNKTKLLY